MILQLATGKCVEMSVEQYLRMSDTDLKNLIATNHGEYYNDPFSHSVLYYGFIKEQIQEETEDFVEPDEVEDLLDITSEEKFDDYTNFDDIE